MSTTTDAHDPSVRIGILAAERPKALDADTSPAKTLGRRFDYDAAGA